MPGKTSWWDPCGAHREVAEDVAMVGSDTPPPRHWRTKAKAAKEREDCYEEEADVEEESRGVERLWWVQGTARGRTMYHFEFINIF